MTTAQIAELNNMCPAAKDAQLGTTVQDAGSTAMNYKGVWDADTNDPALSDSGGGGEQGDFYIVSVDGSTSIDGESDWKIGDWIVNNGSVWNKIDNTDTLVPDGSGNYNLVLASGKFLKLKTDDNNYTDLRSGNIRFVAGGVTSWDFNIDGIQGDPSFTFELEGALNMISTAGVKIGTVAIHKGGFHGKANVQALHIADASGGAGNVDATINAILVALENKGILADA